MLTNLAGLAFTVLIRLDNVRLPSTHLNEETHSPCRNVPASRAALGVATLLLNASATMKPLPIHLDRPSVDNISNIMTFINISITTASTYNAMFRYE